MGDIFSAVVGTMLELIRDLCYKSIGRQFGYLVHCKTNIKDFADEVDKLSLTKARVQIKVVAAGNNDEDLHDDVLGWQRKVQSMEDDKSRLLQSKDNLKCLDVCSRYRLEIMKALKDDGTYKIGIHGMPGVGKTRMMEEVAQQAEKESLFDEVAQIVVSQNPILTDIQQKLAKSLNLELNEELENARKARICNRLRNGKKILVMIDDAWNNEIKLEDIGIPAADNHTKGCKIILTSR
ncbi:probable disease resistance protein At1g61190 [Cornus florida]|uniref:probable disease resistance protein At1g61190 n=1 Tax=Cornus florida TaxID=4283 RepID=UPI00289AEEE8|nr:probable disease resistance protein At1g61190 [Cornus florida]